MCGLFGVYSKRNLLKPEKDFLYLLAYVSFLRGKDATGIFTVDSTGATDMFKATVDPATFFTMSQARALWDKANLRCVFGHTRAKTYGDNVRANAHPFDFENVIGMHNGTIERLCKTDYLDKPVAFGTDSEGIYNKINESGIKAVVPQLEGAWALTMYDKQNKLIHMVRNKQRPLYTLSSDDGAVTFWASEDDFLVFAQNQTRYKCSMTDGFLNTILIPEDMLITMPLDGKELPSIAELKSTKVYSSSYYTHGYTTTSRFNNRTANAETGSVTNNVLRDRQVGNNVVVGAKFDPNSIKPLTTTSAGVTVEPFLPVLRPASKLTKTEFEKVKDNTCLDCGEAVDFDQGGLILQKPSPDGNTEFVGICHRCIERDPSVVVLMKQMA